MSGGCGGCDRYGCPDGATRTGVRMAWRTWQDTGGADSVEDVAGIRGCADSVEDVAAGIGMRDLKMLEMEIEILY